ncbi:putative sporulation protein YtxC [Anaerobacterium chartisolvens]|uniref:Putative sporulation protein YtxC n=1 Tax=Anaerobacterium chartisolvens TaxID=1297424 RepID=A0A369BKI0_9FIRM|nr:putative sporulation protein YtxC [Anaerobacterium chartisolvens]RCX20977.1 putative sporulation protein YtxC [Anaerobacterium chartisolvens]
MRFLCVGVNECADEVFKHINTELKQLKGDNIDYTISKVNSDGSTSIICSISEDRFAGEKSGQYYNTFIVYLSNALADYIIRKYEEKLVSRIINSNYCYFNTTEKKQILNIALNVIRDDDKNFLNSLFRMRRRNVIIRKLMDYFESCDSLILDGFVNFRLKDYMKDLEEIVDKAVDEFLMEREYREFIRLLKYFVEIQDPKFDVIHVIVGYDNRYILLDQNKIEITNECIQEFVNEISEGEINYDDLLVSSLITLAPKNIIIHSTDQFKNKELLETIKNVFSGKVRICGGCEICMINMVKSENKK